MADNDYPGWGGSNGSGGTRPADSIVFSNVRIFDGTGEAPYAGEVTVSGNRIASVARGSNALAFGGSGNRIDGRGMTLMPGLVDAHLHLSWNNAPGIDPHSDDAAGRARAVNCVRDGAPADRLPASPSGYVARPPPSRASTW